ncbi:hypothetical protein Tco_0769008 [Tanacetum coccineum]|uniref:Uncharacterized protein n=1 Tax=Tanacetum coccineum TaxID=301880 RepID=A0ABQ4Z937_9ASTR
MIRYKQPNLRRVVLWDIEAFSLPSAGWEDTGDMHQGVMGRIAELVWEHVSFIKSYLYNAFGKKTTVPTQQEDPYMTGITYFFTSNSPKMKPFSVENVMLVNMLSMATGRLWHQVLISLWPNWEAGASSSSQMEVDEDSAAFIEATISDVFNADSELPSKLGPLISHEP